MAVINNIRKKSGLMIVVIGGAMALFVLSDLLGNGSSFLNSRDTTVGEIKGESIEYQTFEGMVEQRSADASGAQRDQIREAVWNELVRDKVFFSEIRNLGIGVSSEELMDIFRNQPNNPILQRYFTNPQTGQVYDQVKDPVTGLLSATAVLNYVQSMYKQDGGDAQIKPLVDAVREDRMSTKYTNLISQGLLITDNIAKISTQEETDRAVFSYVMKNYSDINDGDISYDESDLKAYYNKHKNEPQYAQEETHRAIKYVALTVTPSNADRNAANEAVKQLLSEFETTTNDTLFVQQYSDNPYNIRYFSQGDLPEVIDSLVLSTDTNTVYGPYQADGAWNITKKLGSKVSPDSVRARHILLPLEGKDTAQVAALADSIKAVIQAKDNFEEMVKEYSEDFGSVDKGGDLDWFTEGRMVREFSEAAFAGEVGDMPIVTSQFGIHIIEITDQTQRKEKVLLATVSRAIVPGNETFDEAYRRASTLALNNKNQEDFIRTAESMEGVEFEEIDFIKESDKTLGNFENPRDIIRWAYDAELGAVSDPFEMGNQFVIATLTSIKEKGILSFENVKDEIEQEVIREKKAEKLIEQSNNQTSLDAIANAWGVSVENVSDLNFASFSVSGIGPENTVIGKAFALPEGQLSEPIKTERGVVYITVNSRVSEEAPSDLARKKDELKRLLSTRVENEVFPALREKANIEDNRSKFF